MGGSARFLRETGRKIGLNVEKLLLFQSLSRHFFHIVRALYFTLSLTKFSPLRSQKAPKKFKNLYFWTSFKQFPHFYPLPSSVLSFKFYYVALSVHYRSYIGENFVFKTTDVYDGLSHEAKENIVSIACFKRSET